MQFERQPENPERREHGFAVRDAADRLRQRRAARPDHEILPLFREPFRPSAFGRIYWATQRRVVREHGLARGFGAAAVEAADGLGDFIDELQGRIEDLTARLAGPDESPSERRGSGKANRNEG